MDTASPLARVRRMVSAFCKMVAISRPPASAATSSKGRRSTLTRPTTAGVVGRVKVERRPLLLVAADAGGREIATILQNAETIRLTRASGEAVSIVTLQPGDEVLVALEERGRHFGHKIQETILEK